MSHCPIFYDRPPPLFPRAASLEEDKENLVQTLRLQLTDKNPCIIAHNVEKPSLMGLRGVVVGNGVDSAGQVTVLVDGQEYKMQEYQLLPDFPEEKQKEMEEMADLKTAKLEVPTPATDPNPKGSVCPPCGGTELATSRSGRPHVCRARHPHACRAPAAGSTTSSSRTRSWSR